MTDIIAKMAGLNLSASSQSPIRIVLESADTFLKVFSSLDELCDSANIIFGEDGISISSMDSSHVCLVSVKFAKEYFHEYTIRPTNISNRHLAGQSPAICWPIMLIGLKHNEIHGK